MRKLMRLFALAGVMLLLPFTVFGQGSTTSSMNGRIVDKAGQPLAGATVLAVHVPSGTQYGSLTNAEGFFTIQGMRTGGPYTVEVSFVGYSKKTFTDITLLLGQAFVLNADLVESTAELGEVLVVGAKPSAFNAVKTGATTNINSTELSSLPSISRSINDFIRLSPLYGGSNTFAGRDNRYNNVVIDGSNFNDNFGLSSKNLPGGEAQPISLDAIEEIQVNVAPYDVREANFTGAGINAITKSGTNKFTGSVYTYYRDQSFNGKKVGNVDLPEAAKTSTKVIGGRVGGPIIKNKLFFFLNGEYENSAFPGMEYVAYRPGLSGTNVSRVPADSLEKFSNLLNDRFGYVTGPYEKYGNFVTENYKILGRIDWNISKTHKFSLRYNTVHNTSNQIVNGTSAPNPRASSNRVSNNAMSFQNTNYGFLNTVGSLSAELRSNFSNRFSNQLLGTYTSMQDTRTSPSSIFPFIDIWDGQATLNAYMSAGYELFTYNNNVLNNVLSLTDNFTYYLGRHTITAGASYENLYFGNSYMRYGTSYYRFKDLQSFVNHLDNPVLYHPIAFGITYSFDPNVTKPVAELTFGQASAYLQDEYNVLDNLKITYGIRVDKPLFLNDLKSNPAVSDLGFNGDTIDVGKWPESKLIWSPRLGFNWDVFGNSSLKVRGGTGLFTGRLPFVWFTNMPTNSGMLQNTVELTSAAQLDSIVFNEDPYYNMGATNWNTTTKTHDALFPTTAGTKAPGSIASISPTFKMPQVWRTSLGVDIKLPLDMTFTLEGMYTEDVNAIIQRNINLKEATGTPYTGPDQRPVWIGGATPDRKYVSSVAEVMVLDNTDIGYSWSFTAQLNFPVVKNFDGMIAYTAMMAKDISGNPGSQAASAWSGNLSVRGQNDLDLSYSQYLTPHRLIGSLSYKFEYAKFFATTIALYYNGYIDGNFSYRYGNDFNQDGVNSDLFYIPKDKSEILFVDIKNTNGTVRHTAAAQEASFWAYMKQDKYLSSHKGEYAGRNATFYPWYHRFDVKILQDIAVNVGGKKNTLQFSCDILNAGNLLNSNWGVHKKLVYSGGSIVNLYTNSSGVPILSSGGQLQFQMAEVNKRLRSSTFENLETTSSTWGIQIGLRYIFN
jgi:hypothetical protein